MTLHLPEGKAWRIDDHTRPELVGIHEATRSELHFAVERQPEVVGRAQCEADARKRGRVPAGDLRTLEDRVTVGPEAYDTRIWIALEISTRGTIRGHLFAFGGMVKILIVLTLALSTSVAFAQDALLKPFVLASRGAGDMAQKLDATKVALAKAGFTVVGGYSPYANTTVIAVTNDELRGTAAKSEHGGYGAAMRVAVVKVKDEVQVSYTNPPYWAAAYRMSGELKDTAAKLQSALGKVEEFDAKGLTVEQLRKYHYAFGMEYFNEDNEFAKYGSHEEAVKAVSSASPGRTIARR